jgi:2-alkenal reductase
LGAPALTAAATLPGLSQARPAQLAAPTSVPDEQAAVMAVYARENPSVVNITIYGQPQATQQRGQPQQQQRGQVAPLGEGSGWVFDAQGDIVTNAHVVQDAVQLDVTFSDGTVKTGKVVGQDLNSDLAVVKVDSLPANVAPLALGNMGDIAVGQTVVAIGNPFGLDGSLTKGIISGLGRNISSLTQFAIPQTIQTDAAINPGNSGGPLLDLAGNVIGVNAQIESGNGSNSNSGVGFAIPVNILSKVIPALIKDGKYEWSWLGVAGNDVTPALAQAMNLPVQRGAYIGDVTSGGPAAQAGLKGATGADTANGRAVQVGGDVVTAVDGQSIKSFDDLLIYVALQTRPGQTVTLTIVRNGQTQDVKLQLGTRPASSF